jgi:hypothetical protein
MKEHHRMILTTELVNYGEDTTNVKYLL